VIFPNFFSAGITGGLGECLDTIIGEHVETDAEQPILEGDNDDIKEMDRKETKRRINKKEEINL
jgi:hypothetical protein